MAMMNKKRSRKGFLMTVLVVVLFTLMIAELLIFTLLNISYNKIQQSSLLASSSVNYASSLISSSQAFAAASLSRALSALTSYEYNASIRKGNFVSNLSQYLSYLIVNGTLPNVAPNSLAANALAMWMGNTTFKAYNASIINNIKPSPLAVKVSESKPIIYQTSPYNLSVSYVENVSIATPSGTQNYSIPVSASIPLNGTYDLFYAQQGVQRPIRFSSINNLTSVVGGAYATYGNSSSNAFIYGIVLHVPSGVTCTSLSSNVPSWANTAPLNKSIILATPNAKSITNATCKIANKFGGLVTYSINSISSPPSIPWLQYSSSTNILGYIPNGTKALLYGPGMDLLNIEALRNAIQNGSYFASPFLPSYIDRADANFLRSSPNGIFTFSGSNRYAAQFNGASGSSYILTSKGYSAPNALTIAGWFISTSFQNNYQFPIDSNPEAYWRIGFNPSNQIYFDPGSHNDQVISTTIKFNSWYFVAFTAQDSGSNTIWNFYLNGIMVASGSVGQNIQSVNAIGLGDYAYYFVGQLSNVQIYNTSLSPSQMQQLYQEGVEGLPLPNAGLIGWWPLNGNANDYSGNGNNGAATNVKFNKLTSYTRDSIYIVPTPKTLPVPGTLSCTSGKNCNPALYISNLPLETSSNFYVAQFNGQNDYIPTLPRSLSVSVFCNLTLAAWSYDSGMPSSGAKGGVVVFAHSGNSQSGWDDIEYNDNTLRFELRNQSTTNAWYVSSNFKGIWIFTALVLKNGVAYSGYINGVAYPNGKYIGCIGYFGRGLIGDWDRYFNGSIANVQIYNTSLSPSQIQQLYQEGIAGSPYTANLVAWYPLDGNTNDYSGNGHNATDYKVYYTPFSGAYSNNGLSAIAGIMNEREAFNLVG